MLKESKTGGLRQAIDLAHSTGKAVWLVLEDDGFIHKQLVTKESIISVYYSKTAKCLVHYDE